VRLEIELKMSEIDAEWFASFLYPPDKVVGSVGVGNTPAEAMARLALQIDYGNLK
jgi:hypothetical protein